MPGAIASANEARETRLNYVGAPCSKSTIQLERERESTALRPAVLHGPEAWVRLVVDEGISV
jgi:hypothetical protein